MKILLFKTEENLENKRDLYLHVKANGDIILDGCDSGPVVKDHYGDFDYEYSITVKQKEVEKLLKIVNSSSDITGFITENYKHQNGFSDFRNLLDEHTIEYEDFFYI